MILCLRAVVQTNPGMPFRHFYCQGNERNSQNYWTFKTDHRKECNWIEYGPHLGDRSYIRLLVEEAEAMGMAAHIRKTLALAVGCCFGNCYLHIRELFSHELWII